MNINAENIKAIFFDLGKVLLDFRHEDLVGRLLVKSESREEKAPELFEFLFDSRLGLCNLYDEGKISSLDFYSKINENFALNADYEEFSALWNGIFSENRDVSAIIARARERRPVFLLSNVNELHWDFVRREFPVLSKMDGWVLSCEVKAKKPSPAIYAAALAAAGVDAGESVFIDDLEENVRAAGESGIYGIVFKGAVDLEEKLAEYRILY